MTKGQSNSITELANSYARKGLTLKSMSESEGIDYSKLKLLLSEAGYIHPRGVSLASNRIQHETGMTLNAYLRYHLAKGLSRNEIALKSGIDNKTLQSFADRHGIEIPKSKPIPKSMENIIAANKKRIQSNRSDLVLIEFNGQSKCLAEWSKELSIPRATIKQRLDLGYPLDEALSKKKRKTRRFSAFNRAHTK